MCFVWQVKIVKFLCLGIKSLFSNRWVSELSRFTGISATWDSCWYWELVWLQGWHLGQWSHSVSVCINLTSHWYSVYIWILHCVFFKYESKHWNSWSEIKFGRTKSFMVYTIIIVYDYINTLCYLCKCETVAYMSLCILVIICYITYT